MNIRCKFDGRKVVNRSQTGADPGGGWGGGGGGCNPLFFCRRQGKSTESEYSHTLSRYATQHAGKHTT